MKLKCTPIYNFIYSDVDKSPDALDKLLKIMVGAKGFEPSTSWSRTRRASQAALRPDGGDLAIRVDTEYARQRDSQINTRRKDWARISTPAFLALQPSILSPFSACSAPLR